MSISPELIKKTVYPPETVAEVRSIDLSSTGAYIPLVELTDIPPWLIKLEQIAYEHQSSNYVTCRVEGSMAGKPILNDTNSLAIPNIDDYIPFKAYFDETMLVRFIAATAAASNYRARVVYTVKKPTVADKLALGITKAGLTDEERRLDRTYEIQRKLASGELPMPYPKGALIRQMVGTLLKDMTGEAAEEKVLEHYVAAGQKVVLTKLWCKRPTDETNLTIRIYHDKKLYFEINPWALPDLASSADTTIMKDRPLELWIQSPSHLKVAMYCGVDEDDVRCMAKFEVRKMTIWDKIGWNKLGDKRITEDWEREMVDELDLADKYLAGLYVLAVPVNLGGRGA